MALALAYLEEGPGAWLPRLADDSPLRSLSPEEARAEILVRAGPPSGARWELQTVVPSLADQTAVFSIGFPSGLAETLTLTLREEADGWRIHSLRSSSDPSPYAVPAGVLTGRAALGQEAGRASIVWLRRGAWTAWWIGAGLLIAVAAAARPRPGHRLATTVGLALATLGAFGLALPWPAKPTPSPPSPLEAIQGEMVHLGALAQTRMALAIEAPDGAAERLAAIDPEGRPGEIVNLWRAETALVEMRLEEAAEILRGIAADSPIPLAHLLDARMRFLQSDEEETVLAYERAIDRGPGHDGLWLEAAIALAILGFEERARTYLDRTRRIGSRNPELHYMVARVALIDGERRWAEEHFRQGWHLQPLERQQIFDDPLLALLVEPGPMAVLVGLGDSEEPRIRPQRWGELPLEVSASAAVHLTGSTVRFELEDARLLVPGGAELAPLSATLEDASDQRRAEERQALERLPLLLQAARSPGALSQPLLRRQLETLAIALAREYRWLELDHMTAPFEEDAETVPPSLLQLRAFALQQLDRREEAVQLLLRVARSNAAARRTDPATLYQLAEALVVLGHFDPAIRLIRQADRQLPYPASDDRIRQIVLERQLARSALTYESPQFLIRHSPRTGRYFVNRLAEVLEAERVRLRRWIPTDATRPIEVHLLPLGEFRQITPGGADVLGYFDGRIRVPLAEALGFHPFIVSILTHELAHALIADATNNQAPHWFHEGLAQRVEMIGTRVNPMREYAVSDRLLGLSVLERALRGFPHPQWVGAAYDQALWIVLYIESRYGVRAIHGLLRAFRDGKSTEEAVEQVLGISVTELDRAARHWSVHQAPSALTAEVIEYDEVTPMIRRAVESAPAARRWREDERR